MAFLEAREGTVSSLNVNGDMVKVGKMTWEKHYKRSLYTDNILQNSADFFNNGFCRLSETLRTKGWSFSRIIR